MVLLGEFISIISIIKVLGTRLPFTEYHVTYNHLAYSHHLNFHKNLQFSNPFCRLVN